LINIEFLTFEELKEKGRKIFNDIVKRKEILMELLFFSYRIFIIYYNIKD
jgi:hypothetical protein